MNVILILFNSFCYKHCSVKHLNCHSSNLCAATIMEYHLAIANDDIVHNETMKCVYLYLRPPTYRITMACTQILRGFNTVISNYNS